MTYQPARSLADSSTPTWSSWYSQQSPSGQAVRGAWTLRDDRGLLFSRLLVTIGGKLGLEREWVMVVPSSCSWTDPRWLNMKVSI